MKHSKVIEITYEEFERLPDRFKWVICYGKTNIKVIHRKKRQSLSVAVLRSNDR